MKDSVSLANGDLSGLTFCGTRSYSIISPATIPSWVTINALSGSLTLTPNDAALGGTSVMLTV